MRWTHFASLTAAQRTRVCVRMENTKELEGRGGIPDSERARWEGRRGERGERVTNDEAWLGRTVPP